MLRSVQAVTYTVSNFDASCSALTSAFGYQPVDSGLVLETLARFWRAPGIAGTRYATFAPASAEPVLLRLIEQPATSGYEPLKTFGWNAAELHVKDVCALAEALVGSPFKILGGPRDLLGDGTAIALQARGPSDEVFYLTEINGAPMQRSYGKAQSSVGRTFIVVLGSAFHNESLEFYSALCENTTEPREFPIRVLAAAHGMDPLETKFPIASAVLPGQFRIEIDAYPDSAVPRPTTNGLLPPGLSIVTFGVQSLKDSPFDLGQLYSGVGRAPYFDQPTALLQGPDGEMLELIESAV